MCRIEKFCDDAARFFVDPLSEKHTPCGQVIACAVTIIAGIATLGLTIGLSALWRHCRHIDEPNETHEKIHSIFQKQFDASHVREIDAIFGVDDVFNKISEKITKDDKTINYYLEDISSKMRSSIARVYVPWAQGHLKAIAIKVECKSTDEELLQMQYHQNMISRFRQNDNLGLVFLYMAPGCKTGWKQNIIGNGIDPRFFYGELVTSQNGPRDETEFQKLIQGKVVQSRNTHSLDENTLHSGPKWQIVDYEAVHQQLFGT